MLFFNNNALPALGRLLNTLPSLGVTSKNFLILSIGSSAGKESSATQKTLVQFPDSGRSLGEGIGYLLQYSWTSLVTQMVKNPQCRTPGFDPWAEKIL